MRFFIWRATRKLKAIFVIPLGDGRNDQRSSVLIAGYVENRGIDLYRVAKKEGFWLLYVSESIVGFNLQLFSAGLTTRLSVSYEQTACECSKTRKSSEQTGRSTPPKRAGEHNRAKGYFGRACGRGNL